MRLWVMIVDVIMGCGKYAQPQPVREAFGFRLPTGEAIVPPYFRANIHEENITFRTAAATTRLSPSLSLNDRYPS